MIINVPQATSVLMTVVRLTDLLIASHVIRGHEVLVANRRLDLIEKVRSLQMLAAFCVMTLAPYFAFSDSTDRFKEEYSHATVALENAYSHVRIKETHTFTHSHQQEKFSYVNSSEIIRNGDSMLGFITTLKSNDPSWPSGSITIDGGDPSLSFSCVKPVGAKDFRFEWFGPDPDFQLTSPLTFGVTFAPYCIEQYKLVDLLGMANRHIISVVSTKFDGEDAIELTCELDYVADQKQQIMRQQFYFQPKTCAILGWTSQRGVVTLHTRIRYGIAVVNDMPPIKSIESFREESTDPRVRENEESWDIMEFEFVTIPKKEFTPTALAQFGVKDIPVDNVIQNPATSQDSSRTPSPDHAALPVPYNTTRDIIPAPTALRVEAAAPSRSIPLWAYGLLVTLLVGAGILLRAKARRMKRKN